VVAEIPAADLDVYRLAAKTYRQARRVGALEKDCHFAATRAVLSVWPWLGEEPAGVLAREIILFISREYPEWFWR
jgi:hypothetical protein